MAAMDAISRISSVSAFAAPRQVYTPSVRVVRGEVPPVNAVKSVQDQHSLEAQIRLGKASSEATGRLLNILA